MAKHTGRIHHPDMVSHMGLGGTGKKDPHASAEHHAANKAHGMPHGMCPADEHGGECEEGGEGMAGNTEYT
jgi:hypothetical protein